MTILAGLAAAVLLWWLLKPYLKPLLSGDRAALMGKLRQAAGFVAIGIGVLMGLRGRIDAAVFAGGVGAWLIGWSGRPTWLGGGEAAGPARFRSAMLEASFDPATRRIDGRVIAGRLAGRPFDTLDMPALIALRAECRQVDPDGVGLLEAYLDSRFPGWREHADADGDAGPHVRRGASAMSQEEAYEVLGLRPGAGPDEIRRAHRALIKKLHPDQGGTDDLAARVNGAKDVLMRRHR